MTRSRRWVILAGCVLTASLAWGQGGFNGPGTYEIRNVKSGKVLDLDPADRVTLIQSTPRGSRSQTWRITPADTPGYFFITNMETDRALEFVRDSNASPVVAQNQTAQNPNQSWQIQARGAGVWILSRFRKGLDVPSGSDREGLRLQIYDRSGAANQQYTMRRVEDRRGDDRRDDRKDGDRRRDDR